MRGFTLFEVIIYMAISTFMCTSLIAFSLSLISSQAATNRNLESELTGNTLVRLMATTLQALQPIEPLLSESSTTISNFTLSTTSVLTTITFAINKQTFTLTFKP